MITILNSSDRNNSNSAHNSDNRLPRERGPPPLRLRQRRREAEGWGCLLGLTPSNRSSPPVINYI